MHLSKSEPSVARAAEGGSSNERLSTKTHPVSQCGGVIEGAAPWADALPPSCRDSLGCGLQELLHGCGHIMEGEAWQAFNAGARL